MPDPRADRRESDMNDSTRLATLAQWRVGPLNAFALAAIYANGPQCTRLVRQLDRGIALPGEVAYAAIRLAFTTMVEWGVTR